MNASTCRINQKILSSSFRRVMASALLSGFLAASASAKEVADKIWMGGTILTMNDAGMRADAVAMRDGKIVAIGKKADVMKLKGSKTRVLDLAGRTLLPGFVDAHGHVLFGGLQALSANVLAPPDGKVSDMASLKASVREWMAANAEAVKKTNLVIGFGYDPATLAEQRHPTREDLDAISKELPVILVHQSGHLFAVNSRALEIAGITAATADPQGGVIRRGKDGKEPNGVLEETAGFPVLFKLLAQVGEDGNEAFFRAGMQLWSRYGYTTAQDGRSAPETVRVMQKIARQGELKIDVVSYPDVLVDRDFIKKNVSRHYAQRFRVAGAKLTIDGSPQGFTAWRDRPYYQPVGDYPEGYRGYPAATVDQTVDAVNWAYANNIQILTHSNGEAASDLLIAAITLARLKNGDDKDVRPVLIHGQFLREDQVDSLQRLGIFPSLFPMHTFYWGDWHTAHTVGPELGKNISPTAWVRQRGMMFSTHHDAPVAFPDSMRVLDATVTRVARGSGKVIGPEQRVDVITALKAMTIWPAWQHFEEDRKGSLEVGKLADFVILSQDPTAVAPDALDQIKVTETIKEGETVFRLPAADSAVAPATDAFAKMLRAMSRVGAADALHEPGEACPADALLQLSWAMTGKLD